MIIGTGNDMCDIRRIEKALARFGARFEARVFTPAEQAKARSRSHAGEQIIAATYAKRFAAKEACAKALGARGMSWLDIEVSNAENGAPQLTLSGGALTKLQERTPPGMQPKLWLTLTDAYPHAQAHVVIEAIAAV